LSFTSAIHDGPTPRESPPRDGFDLQGANLIGVPLGVAAHSPISFPGGANIRFDKPTCRPSIECVNQQRRASGPGNKCAAWVKVQTPLRSQQTRKETGKESASTVLSSFSRAPPTLPWADHVSAASRVIRL